MSWKEFDKIPAQERALLEQEKYERIKKLLSDKEQVIAEGNILIVTHGGFMCTLLAVILNLPLDVVGSISISNTAYVQIYFSGSEWVIEKTEGITLPASLQINDTVQDYVRSAL